MTRLPAAPPTPTPWKALGLMLLALVLVGLGLLWWLFGGPDAPGDAGLDPQRWQRVRPGLSGRENPRRDMVRSVNRWLNFEHPGREQVRALLGRPDTSDATSDSWNIGCFTEYAFCMDGDALLVTYPGERASSRIESY